MAAEQAQRAAKELKCDGCGCRIRSHGNAVNGKNYCIKCFRASRISRPESMKFECLFDGCSYRSPNLSALRYHVIHHHQHNGKCPVCGKEVGISGMTSHCLHKGIAHEDYWHIVYFSLALCKWSKGKRTVKKYRDLAVEASRIPVKQKLKPRW